MTIHTEPESNARAAPPGDAPPPGGDDAARGDGAAALVLRANKLDLLERLADDLAHEIKNPLHSMVINLEVLKRRVSKVAGDQDDLQRYFGVLSGELERVNRRIELLLRLSRPGRGAESTTMGELVEELMELVQLEARHRDATVDYQPALGAVRVRVPRESARQVILNLVMEALDAGGTGPLVVRVGHEGGEAYLALGRGEGAAAEVDGAAGRLGIARDLARSVGGRVGAGALPSGGPALVFTLPVVPA